jgi:hypothetical protein
MSTIDITTNVGCRVRCDFCPQDKLLPAYQRRGGVRQMTFTAYGEILGKIPPDTSLDFSGMAEPWLNPDCTEMLLHAHDRGYEVAAFTTTVGMNESDVERIKSIPFRRFVVHLPDREGYSKIDVDDGYLKTLERIVGSAIANCEFMTMGTLPREVATILGRRIRRTRMMSRAGNLANIRAPMRRAGPISCRSCGDSLDHNLLLPNGDVVLCCMDYGLQHVLGNLLVSDYRELFEGEEFRRVQAGLHDDSFDILCRYCENASSPQECNRSEKRKWFGNLRSLLKGFMPPSGENHPPP